MLIGYARVPTGDQSLILQIDALEEAGCDRVFRTRLAGLSILDQISIEHLISLGLEALAPIVYKSLIFM